MDKLKSDFPRSMTFEINPLQSILINEHPIIVYVTIVFNSYKVLSITPYYKINHKMVQINWANHSKNKMSTKPPNKAERESDVIATWASLEGGVVLEVPLSCFARAWKAAKFLEPDSTALAEKTIP